MDNIYEGGRYIFNDIPIVWARWPTHGGIVIISGRALIVVVVALLFGGGIVVVGRVAIIISVGDCNRQSRCLNRSRWQRVGHPAAWWLPIADLEGVVRAMVACRVGGGNDAAAMRVVSREIGLPWLVSVLE